MAGLTLASFAAIREAKAQGFGDPLAGLTAAQLQAFLDGKGEFEAIETPEEGLGPVFNEASCVVCHDAAATGGAGVRSETRFGRLTSTGRFDPMTEFGGSLIQDHGITVGACVQPPETVPPQATIIAGRNTQPLFGLGFVDVLNESQILANADPNDANGDGISGRPNIVKDPVTGQNRVGRFGWKAQVPSLFVFSGDAYLNEMGITNNIFPDESAPNGGAITCDDGHPAPEIDDEDLNGNGISDGVEAFNNFMRFLGPPPTLPATTDSAQGSRIFVAIRCSACHVPSFVTPNVPEIPALSNKRFFPFSDFLLHGMGSLGDGIVQGISQQREMRTAPLWGLRETAPFLHDGSAATVTDAILAHDGEGLASRNAFRGLTARQKQQLLAFLNSI
jgi:CxxC motif-containing protein (DUF1111 family)